MSPKCPNGLPADQNVGRRALPDPVGLLVRLPLEEAPAGPVEGSVRPKKLPLAKARALPRNPRRRNPAAREKRLRKNRPRSPRAAARKRNANSLRSSFRTNGRPELFGPSFVLLAWGFFPLFVRELAPDRQCATSMWEYFSRHRKHHWKQ